jgi:hypothetical protein
MLNQLKNTIVDFKLIVPKRTRKATSIFYIILCLEKFLCQELCAVLIKQNSSIDNLDGIIY